MEAQVKGPVGAVGRFFARRARRGAEQWERHPYRSLGLALVIPAANVVVNKLSRNAGAEEHRVSGDAGGRTALGALLLNSLRPFPAASFDDQSGETTIRIDGRTWSFSARQMRQLRPRFDQMSRSCALAEAYLEGEL